LELEWQFDLVLCSLARKADLVIGVDEQHGSVLGYTVMTRFFPLWYAGTVGNILKRLIFHEECSKGILEMH
jgi:hypothetical protein